MVYLNRIYTKSGDAGETALGNGARVSKTHPRILAYGGTDELNSLLGVALTDDLPRQTAEWLRHVQNDLFDLGADLCVPETDPPPEHEPLRVTARQIETLEGWIDSVSERLEPLESFILPGGTRAAAHLHHARAVCRRVETQVLRLVEAESINPNVAVYLNRLSDLLFVLARLCNNAGADDVLWKPGMGRGDG